MNVLPREMKSDGLLAKHMIVQVWSCGIESHGSVVRHGRSIRGFDSLIKCRVEGQMEGLFFRFVPANY
jgi:hypothetical protein